MDEMLNERYGDWKNDNLEDWVKHFYKRKWNSEFSKEMSRSCKAMLNHWLGEE